MQPDWGPHSPLLDWISALRRGFWKLALCIVLGAALFSLPPLLRPEPPGFRSTAVLVTEIDEFERLIGRIVGAPVDRDDRAATDAVIFEGGAKSAGVLLRTLRRLEREKGYNNLDELGLSSMAGDIDDAQRDERILFALRQQALSFDYEIGSRRIALTVEASSQLYARDLAATLAEEASRRFSSRKRQKMDAYLVEIKTSRTRVENRLGELYADHLELQAAASSDSEFADQPLRSQIERGIGANQRNLDNLKKLEESAILLRQLNRPLIHVIRQPELPSRPTSVVRSVAQRAALGATLGLLIGLLWIAYRSHVATMSVLNPKTYGGDN